MTATTDPADKPTKPEFSFITTCKGRLHHLQHTLPLMVQQMNSEVVVVDYGCPQHAGDWVVQHHPQVNVVRVTDDSGFRISRARNLGAQASQAPWLVFIDADILLTGDLLSWLRPLLKPGRFFRSGSGDYNHYGTFVCHRSDFQRVKGFDEILVGWGREDKDIYYRLALAGCEEIFFPGDIISAIQHGDEARTQFSPYKNKLISQIISTLYLQMKYDLESLQPERSTKEIHQKLYEHARQTILNGLGQAPDANMIAQLLLGPLAGPAAANPLYRIERKMVYKVKKHPQGDTF